MPLMLNQTDEDLLLACPPMPILKLSRQEHSGNWGSTFLSPFLEYDIPPRCFANQHQINLNHAMKNIFEGTQHLTASAPLFNPYLD